MAQEDTRIDLKSPVVKTPVVNCKNSSKEKMDRIFHNGIRTNFVF